MIDAMFQDGTDVVLDDRVARPVAPQPVRPSFGVSLWNTTKAPFKGGAAGATDSAAFGSDILGAFGSVQAGYGMQADPAMLFDSDMQERAKTEGARARADVQSGEAFSTETGTGLRSTARGLMPDAATSNIAENLLFGVSRFGIKAIGYTLTAGPVMGPILTGADEGMSEADKLKVEGVDLTTRTKVGAVAGVAAAAQTALPIAGKTLTQTAGLYLVGGPGGFMAQQAASRAILKHADYAQIGDQYDPFDPVGLAVATLVPAGFAAYAARSMRGAKPAAAPVDPVASRALGNNENPNIVSMSRNERVALRYDDPRLDAYAVASAQREGVPADLLLALKNAGEKSGSRSTSPKGAQGVAQLMPENQRKYGVTDAQDPVQSIDGMAKYVRDTMKQYDGNVQAVIADYNGGPKQAKRVLAGMEPDYLETAKYVRRVNEFMAERGGAEAGRRAASDPDAVAAARVNLVRETVNSWNLKDPADLAGAEQHLTAFLRASDQIGAGDRVSVGDAVTLDKLSHARMLDDFTTRLETARADLLPDAAGIADPGVIRTMRDQIAELQQSRPAATDEAVRTAAKQIQTEQGISYKAALSAAKKDLSGRLGEVDGRIEALQNQIEQHAGRVQATEQLRKLDDQISQVKADRAAIDAPTPSRAALAVKQAVADIPAARAPDGAKVGTGADGATKAQENAPPAPKPATEQPAAGTSARESGTASAALDSQTAEIGRLAPDLMVQLEGMDKPMRLSDALDAVKAEAAKEKQDAGLLQVAAECFLRNA